MRYRPRNRDDRAITVKVSAPQFRYLTTAQTAPCREQNQHAESCRLRITTQLIGQGFKLDDRRDDRFAFGRRVHRPFDMARISVQKAIFHGGRTDRVQ